MKKQLLGMAFMGLLILMVFACKKKDSDSTTTTTPTGSQMTINNKTYAATTQVNVPNDSIIMHGTFHPAIPSGGGYLSYTYTSQGKYYYAFLQANIPNTGDTLSSGVFIQSSTPIAAGNTYTIYGASAVHPTTCASLFYHDSQTSYNDSAATGTVVITKIDMTNKIVSGTFSYNATGTIGSNPAALTITNGQFNNIGLQEF